MNKVIRNEVGWGRIVSSRNVQWPKRTGADSYKGRDRFAHVRCHNDGNNRYQLLMLLPGFMPKPGFN